MKYSQKGHKDRNRHKNRIKRSGQAQVVYVKNLITTFPSREGEPAGTIVYVLICVCTDVLTQIPRNG